VRVALLLLVLPLSVFAGSFTLERRGDAYSLRAEQALLSDILAEIDRQEPASLKFYGDYARPVSATYTDISLDRLLDKLGVSYVLVYEADDDGAYRLGDAMMLDSDAPPDDPASAPAIKKLVRALRHDNIRFNAIDAYWTLYQMGCDAVPYLEEALYDTDFQGRHSAATLLRTICPEHTASDRLIEVSFELLTGPLEEGRDVIWPNTAYDFLNASNIYPRARSRILANVQNPNRRVRLYSSMIAGNHGETGYAATLARTLVPHLADNDLRNDAAASAYALHQLGPSVLPHLRPYRNSPDPQQAELVDLIMRSLESGTTPSFEPTMYVSYNKTPILEPSGVNVVNWNDEDFPDERGTYPDLSQPRMTTADYYGPYTAIEEYTPFRYVVKQGDTMVTIAEQFVIPLDALIRSNPDTDFSRTPPIGSVLFIPFE
jgi:hypothetical protein